MANVDEELLSSYPVQFEDAYFASGETLGATSTASVEIPRPAKPPGSDDVLWDRIRRSEYYQTRRGEGELCNKFESGRNYVGPEPMLVTNTTDFVLASLFMPLLAGGWKFVRELDRGLSASLASFNHPRAGSYPSGYRMSFNSMITRMYSLRDRLFTYHKKAESTGTYSSRLLAVRTFQMMFMTCIQYEKLLNVLSIEGRPVDSNSDQTFHGPDILWGIVVPQEDSVAFHYAFLNMMPIVPAKFRLQLWYNIEEIHKTPTVFRLFNTVVTDLCQRLGLIAVSKTKAEMAALLTPYKKAFPQPKTLEEKKLLGAETVRKVLSDQVQAVFDD